LIGLPAAMLAAGGGDHQRESGFRCRLADPASADGRAATCDRRAWILWI